MELNSAIKKRKSTRDFKRKKPSFKDILEAIDAAIQGPFAGNINNLKFIIIESKDSIEDISNHTGQKWVQNSPALIIVTSNDSHLEDLYGERGRVYSRQQAGAAISTLLLRLTDLGLTGSWIGAYSDERIKQSLGIPEKIQIEAIIPIGYAQNPKEKKKTKTTIEEATYWEVWERNRRPTIFPDPQR
ncbi:hypothetical protein CMI47_16345 [Candidatus Pacearchaeota archaeon]|nr:hypothetical protein [Candidatus Pacearchaeota archaeon]|tara:strand:+ start:3663 stop:4223 length:561 start_codon:yes stop_codon:yes gene_type:complete